MSPDHLPSACVPAEPLRAAARPGAIVPAMQRPGRQPGSAGKEGCLFLTTCQGMKHGSLMERLRLPRGECKARVITVITQPHRPHPLSKVGAATSAGAPVSNWPPSCPGGRQSRAGSLLGDSRWPADDIGSCTLPGSQEMGPRVLGCVSHRAAGVAMPGLLVTLILPDLPSAWRRRQGLYLKRFDQDGKDRKS